MTTTVAKTYRFSSALYKLIVDESEKTKTSEAEVVRLALRRHFESRQDDERLDVLEKRVVANIKYESQLLASLIQQVIAMAQPE